MVLAPCQRPTAAECVRLPRTRCVGRAAHYAHAPDLLPRRTLDHLHAHEPLDQGSQNVPTRTDTSATFNVRQGCGCSKGAGGRMGATCMQPDTGPRTKPRSPFAEALVQAGSCILGLQQGCDERAVCASQRLRRFHSNGTASPGRSATAAAPCSAGGDAQ